VTRHVTTMTIDDAAHISEARKLELIAQYPPHERDARLYGKPKLGAGAIYPIPLDEVLVEPMQIPAWWPRCYALDVGWNRTAALWGAWDRETDRLYLYTEHYRGQAEPSIHVSAIKARGEWIPGVIDPAARGRSQVDGTQLMATYTSLGLRLGVANNAVEAGIYACWERLSTGRLKVFRTLQNWQTEYGRYRRDENGKIVKQNDHLVDAMRYLVMAGVGSGAVEPSKKRMAPIDRGDTTAGY
jgi:hypothetical protein